MIVLKQGMKRQQLVESFKDQIISGVLNDKGRLPTYDELNCRFDASRATFHHVVEQLKQDGFIVSVERKGLFIVDNLPCRNRFALVFESDEHDNLFWTKLAQEARKINRTQKGCQFEIFHSDNCEHDDSLQLLDLLQRRMIAGMFFFFRPSKSLVMKIRRDFPDVPRIFTDNYEGVGDYFHIHLNAGSCVNKVMEYALQNGARRIGLISRGEQELIKPFAAIAEKNQICTRPEWILSSPEKYIGAVKNLVRLLMGQPSENRPDTLYVTDDNLLPLIESTLVEMGIKVPEELKLICHFNFPDQSRTVLPVKKVGYDVRDILNKGVSLITQYYAGRTERSVLVDGKYDSEII